MRKRNYHFGRCCDLPSYHRDMEWIGENRNGKSSALEILNIRYAKGEIDKEEYDKIKKEIQ